MYITSQYLLNIVVFFLYNSLKFICCTELLEQFLELLAILYTVTAICMAHIMFGRFYDKLQKRMLCENLTLLSRMLSDTTHSFLCNEGLVNPNMFHPQFYDQDFYTSVIFCAACDSHSDLGDYWLILSDIKMNKMWANIYCFTKNVFFGSGCKFWFKKKCKQYIKAMLNIFSILDL